MRASLTGLFGLAVLWRLALPCDLHAQQTAPGTRLFVCMYESPSSGPADRPAGVRTGLAISADQGATWRNSGWQIGTTNDIAGDPRHPGTLYDQFQLNNDSNRLNGRSCTNCHQTVHGSNHPSGKTFLR